MQLITTQCLWLECCNCGGVYEDIWANIHKEEPICPYCGRTWYINTEKYKVHGPTKKHKVFSLNRELPSISPRWQRYQRLVAYLEKLPVDEWIAHETAWRLSKAEKINMIYVARNAIVGTIDCVLGWRGHPKYTEISWLNGIEENSPWEEISLENADTGQNTERRAFALISLKSILDVWDSYANSGLTLWEALAVRRPSNDATAKKHRFYKKVRSQLLRLRRRCVEKR